MTPPSTVRDLIDLWPSKPALGRFLAVSAGIVWGWYRNESIPDRYWMRLSEVAEQCGFPGINYAMIRELHRA